MFHLDRNGCRPEGTHASRLIPLPDLWTFAETTCPTTPCGMSA